VAGTVSACWCGCDSTDVDALGEAASLRSSALVDEAPSPGPLALPVAAVAEARSGTVPFGPAVAGASPSGALRGSLPFVEVVGPASFGRRVESGSTGSSEPIPRFLVAADPAPAAESALPSPTR